MEDGRAAMLKSIMTADAKERLSRVALVRPDNARAVEEHLIRLARGGKLQSQVDEDTVKRLLEDVGKMVEGKSVVKKVTITRKKRMDDDDDDLEGL
jgi:programmed cell death protein 5